MEIVLVKLPRIGSKDFSTLYEGKKLVLELGKAKEVNDRFGNELCKKWKGFIVDTEVKKKADKRKENAKKALLKEIAEEKKAKEAEEKKSKNKMMPNSGHNK